jgi:hypothetical protein
MSYDNSILIKYKNVVYLYNCPYSRIRKPGHLLQYNGTYLNSLEYPAPGYYYTYKSAFVTKME